MASCGKLICGNDEQFCNCVTCQKPSSELKVLPCLHRFCKNCLGLLFVNLTVGDIFHCPLCAVEVHVTKSGVDDLKTDLLVNEVRKIIQLQTSLQNQTQIRRCEGCKKEDKSAGFCSACDGFLCLNCLQFHQKFKTGMLKDHQPVIDFEDVFSGKVKLGTENLSQLFKAPRCQNHPENILRLSCVTCDGQQICITCTYEDHVEHRVQSIRNMAGKQRDDLQEGLEKLQPILINWKTNFSRLTDITQNLSFAVAKLRGNVRSVTDEKLQTLNIERDNVTLLTEKIVSELKERSALEKTCLENERDDQVRKIEKHFNELLKKHRADVESNIEREISQGKKRKDEIEEQMKTLNAHKDEIMTFLSRQMKHQNLCLEDLKRGFWNSEKRMQSFIATASIALTIENGWSFVSVTPDISSAFDDIQNNISALQQKLDKIETEARNVPSFFRSSRPEEVGHFERANSVDATTDISHLPFEAIVDTVFLQLQGRLAITGSPAAHTSGIVITGPSTGETEYHKIFPGCPTEEPCRHMCEVDEDIIATACDNIIEIIHFNRSIHRKIKAEGSRVHCICFDYTLKQILTNQEEDDTAKVFDLDLTLVKTRKLPFPPTAACMATSDDRLIIGVQMLDKPGDNIFVLSKEDQILGVIPFPSLQIEEGMCWACRKLCVSKRGTLYTLWTKSDEYDGFDYEAHVVLYGPSYHSLERITVNNDVGCITVAEEEGRERLIVAAGDKLYFHKPWLALLQNEYHHHK